MAESLFYVWRRTVATNQIVVDERIFDLAQSDYR